MTAIIYTILLLLLILITIIIIIPSCLDVVYTQ